MKNNSWKTACKEEISPDFNIVNYLFMLSVKDEETDKEQWKKYLLFKDTEMLWNSRWFIVLPFRYSQVPW